MIHTKLTEFNEQLASEIENFAWRQEPEELYFPIRDLFQKDSTYFHGSLLMLCTYLFQENIKESIKPAIGMELFYRFVSMTKEHLRELSEAGKSVQNTDGPDQNAVILTGDVMVIYTFKFLSEVWPPEIEAFLYRLFEQSVTIMKGMEYNGDITTPEELTSPAYLSYLKECLIPMTTFSAQAGGLIGKTGNNGKNLDLLREFGEGAGMAFHLKKELEKLNDKGEKAEEQIKRSYLNSLSALNKLAVNPSRKKLVQHYLESFVK